MVLGITVLLNSQCPGGSGLCQVPAATLILWHLEIHPLVAHLALQVAVCP